MAEDKSQNNNQNKFLRISEIEGAVTIILLVIIAYLFIQGLATQYNYGKLQSSYASLQSSYTAAQGSVLRYQTWISTLSTNFNNLMGTYNRTRYNITHYQSVVLFSNQQMQIQASFFSQFNITTRQGNAQGAWTPANFTYYYNATCPGYFLFNAVSSGYSSLNWISISDSQSKPQLKYGKAIANASYTFAPVNSVSYKIPILNGSNYFVINNQNVSQAQTLIFNLTYFHHTC